MRLVYDRFGNLGEAAVSAADNEETMELVIVQPFSTVEIRATATFRPEYRDARTVPLTDQFAAAINAQWPVTESKPRSSLRAAGLPG